MNILRLLDFLFVHRKMLGIYWFSHWSQYHEIHVYCKPGNICGRKFMQILGNCLKNLFILRFLISWIQFSSSVKSTDTFHFAHLIFAD